MFFKGMSFVRKRVDLKSLYLWNWETLLKEHFPLKAEQHTIYVKICQINKFRFMFQLDSYMLFQDLTFFWGKVSQKNVMNSLNVKMYHGCKFKDFDTFWEALWHLSMDLGLKIFASELLPVNLHSLLIGYSELLYFFSFHIHPPNPFFLQLFYFSLIFCLHFFPYSEKMCIFASQVQQPTCFILMLVWK